MILFTKMSNDSSKKKSSFELRTYVIYSRDLSICSSERRTKALNEHKLIYRGMLNKDVGTNHTHYTREPRPLIEIYSETNGDITH